MQCTLFLLEQDVLSGRGIRSGVAEGAPERVMRACAGGWPSNLWQAVLAGEVEERWVLLSQQGGAITQCVYTEECVGTSEDKGTGLVTPCSQRNVFIPVVLSANFPSPSGHFYSMMAWGAGGGRGGQDILEHSPAMLVNAVSEPP